MFKLTFFRYFHLRHCHWLLLAIGVFWLSPPACYSQPEQPLRLSIYRNGKGVSKSELPRVFPSHRPFKLLLRYRGQVATGLNMLQIADTLAALQRLAGLQYYSRTEKKKTTLFKESAVVPFPSARRATTDPVFRSLPIDTTFYFYQVDNRLGKVSYRADLKASRTRVTFFAYNVTPVNKFGLQLAAIGDFLLYVEIEKHKNNLEFDLWQWMRFKSGILGILVKEESFVNRLKAIAGHYVEAVGK